MCDMRIEFQVPVQSQVKDERQVRPEIHLLFSSVARSVSPSVGRSVGLLTDAGVSTPVSVLVSVGFAI